MKKILKYFALVSLCTAALVACKKDELDTDQYGQGVTLSALAPNPVMRGGELRILGSNVDQVASVKFAGDVTVTDITVVKTGAKGEIRVIVPLEGPEVGKVTIVSKDGLSSSSRFDLTFSEPIEITSFSPATVLSGDVLTFKGEYLNDVKEVIFSGEETAVATEFVSQSRHELKVKVPHNAITGPVILSDVNEIEDQNTIPNHIYTATDLVVGQPTVVKAEKATYKSGDVIKVDGEHLDMIKTVSLTQAADVKFLRGREADWITFNLPPEATDGHIILTSFAGDTFDAGEIETVNVRDLAVVSLAEDQRFKAGCDVEITGTDLNLVTKVEFSNAEAAWYLSGEKIIATQPAAAKDGAVKVTLESGKQAYSEDIEVVKPEISDCEFFDEYVAGKTVVTVRGEDLDLVTSVTMGDKDHGFIPCEYELITDETGYTDVKVKIPEQAYTSPITFASAAGYETATVTLEITYDMAVSIEFDKASYQLGNNITIKGENLLQIEQVYIKGKKVTSFAVRSDDAMSFALPDKVGPGVYRLGLVLTDGTEMTWPVPFEVTAPYTETYIWKGSAIINGWSGVTFGDDRYIWKTLGAAVGDIVRIYYTAPETGWWDLQLVNGCWDNLSLKELGGGNEIKQDAGFPGGSQVFSFEITEEVLACLNTDKGWGGAFIINGDGNVEITGISLIQFVSGETKNIIWEGSHEVNWSGDLGEDHKSLSALAYGGFDWSKVSEGTTLALSFDRTGDDVQIRLGNGSWVALPGTTDPYKPEGTELRVELTAAMLAEMVANGGLVITGQFFKLTEVALVTAGGSTGKTIWEGSHAIDWGGSDEDHKCVKALAYGGFDWSTVEAGTTLALEFERTADEVQIRLGNGSWVALPGTEDPFKPEGTSLEVELTQAMLDEMVANGGLVITGQGYTLTTVILK